MDRNSKFPNTPPFKKPRNKQQGFTLIEIIITVSIIGIVLSIGIVSMKASGNARAEKLALSDFALLLQNASRYARSHQSEMELQINSSKAQVYQGLNPVEDLEITLPSQLHIVPQAFKFEDDGTPITKAFTFQGSYDQGEMTLSLDGEVNRVPK